LERLEIRYKDAKRAIGTLSEILQQPLSVIVRDAFTVGVINEAETVKLLEMTDDRNMTSHTYKEGVAQIIYGKLKEYSRLMEDVLGRLKV
jgi:hypothetical protein